MSIRQYFKPVNGLPDSRGTLSKSIPSNVIDAVNTEVARAMEESGNSKQRGSYNRCMSRSYVVEFSFYVDCFLSCRYSDKIRADIAKYACLHGTNSATSKFSWKLGVHVSRSSVNSIKKAYLKHRRETDPDEQVTSLPQKKRGRPCLLGDLEKQLRLYLLKLREQGGIVTASVVRAAARGIVMSYCPTQLTELGGHSKPWAYHLLERMQFVKRKATTAKSKHKPQDFIKLKEAFLADVSSVVEIEDIPAELILNWDQTGIRLVPAASWTTDKVGSKRVEITRVGEKRQITVVLCGSMIGDYLPLQVIYQGKTKRCHPNYNFPLDWNVTQSPKHWSTERTMIDYIKEIIVPYVDSTRDLLGFEPSQSALVIIDNFKGQVTDSVNSLLEQNNIHTCLLPPNTTDLLQPLDISVNKPVKDFLKKKFELWYADEVAKQLVGVTDIEGVDIQPVNLCFAAIKVLIAKWLVKMSDYLSENPCFLVNGFKRAGINNSLRWDNHQYGT